MVMKTVAINSIILENNKKPIHMTSTSSHKNVAGLFYSLSLTSRTLLAQYFDVGASGLKSELLK